MRGQGAGRKAAALCALAVFACALCWGYLRAEAKAPLEIEVIAPAHEAQETQTGEQPRVLIYHTHTWEAYEPEEENAYVPTEKWRTKDEQWNMVRVGEELAAALREKGFEVVHDKTAFEPPNISRAYERSLKMLETRLAAGERYDYILDIHRDAYSGLYNGANCVTRGGVSMAYVMLLVGKGTGATGSGFDERPDWPRNLELAQSVTQALGTIVPGISREVKVKSGRFNQHVSTGALLIEVGNNRNTLTEALAACPVIAQALAQVHAARSGEQR